MIFFSPYLIIWLLLKFLFTLVETTRSPTEAASTIAIQKASVNDALIKIYP